MHYTLHILHSAYNALHYSQCITVHYSALQCITVHYTYSQMSVFLWAAQSPVCVLRWPGEVRWSSLVGRLVQWPGEGGKVGHPGLEAQSCLSKQGTDPCWGEWVWALAAGQAGCGRLAGEGDRWGEGPVRGRSLLTRDVWIPHLTLCH